MNDANATLLAYAMSFTLLLAYVAWMAIALHRASSRARATKPGIPVRGQARETVTSELKPRSTVRVP